MTVVDQILTFLGNDWKTVQEVKSHFNGKIRSDIIHCNLFNTAFKWKKDKLASRLATEKTLIIKGVIHSFKNKDEALIKVAEHIADLREAKYNVSTCTQSKQILVGPNMNIIIGESFNLYAEGDFITFNWE